MEIIYYMIGFCLINLFWIVPFSIIAALIANGIINTISLFVFFCMAKRKNTIPLTRISAIKILMHWRHFFEMCFHEQKYSKYYYDFGIWSGAFSFVVYRGKVCQHT